MFDVYGEFGSAEEINLTAEKLFNAGEMDGLSTLAKENGIPRDFVDMYVDGAVSTLCDDMLAAEGKINVEADDLGAEGIMEDWVEYIRAAVSDDRTMAAAVRRKGKSLVGAIGRLAAYAMTHAETLPPEVITAMDKAVTNDQLAKLGIQRSWIKRTKFGVPNMRMAKKIIRDYYTEG